MHLSPTSKLGYLSFKSSDDLQCVKENCKEIEKIKMIVAS